MSRIKERLKQCKDEYSKYNKFNRLYVSDVLEMLEQLQDDLEQDEKVNGWIPVAKKLPEDCVPVNITWINHKPESYYANIKDAPFTATGVLCNGKWLWYSSVCEDLLKGYGRNDVDEVNEDIEITAWMPLSEPYKED